MILEVGDVYTTEVESPMNSVKRRRHDRIVLLGLLALLLAAACGGSAHPGTPDAGDPGTPDAGRTYRIRRLADAPLARTGHVAIGLADGSALVMGPNAGCPGVVLEAFAAGTAGVAFTWGTGSAAHTWTVTGP